MKNHINKIVALAAVVLFVVAFSVFSYANRGENGGLVVEDCGCSNFSEDRENNYLSRDNDMSYFRERGYITPAELLLIVHNLDLTYYELEYILEFLSNVDNLIAPSCMVPDPNVGGIYCDPIISNLLGICVGWPSPAPCP